MNEQIVLDIIKNDPWRMAALEAVRSIGLPDWLIGAGFVRNPVWDVLHDFEHKSENTDIDVAYFDPTDLSIESENHYQEMLRKIFKADWSVTNQARMAKENNQSRDYVSTIDAIAHWPETATAIGITMLSDGEIKVFAPYGLDDLLSLKIRMSPGFGDGYEAFLDRVNKKQWLVKWPKLRIA